MTVYRVMADNKTGNTIQERFEKLHDGELLSKTKAIKIAKREHAKSGKEVIVLEIVLKTGKTLQPVSMRLIYTSKGECNEDI